MNRLRGGNERGTRPARPRPTFGEIGELSVGAVGDVAVWKLDGPVFAGVVEDLIEGWLRTGPHAAWHTIVAGRPIVESGLLVAVDLDEKLAAHAAAARRFRPD